MTALRILAALSLLSLIACSEKAPTTAANSTSGSDAAGSSAPPPPIHYDQTTVFTSDGQPADERNYRFLLDACQKGGFPIHALAPSEVEKIGREHVETWIGPDKLARHDESWRFHVEVSAPCIFSLIHQDQTEITDASGRSTLINNVTHEVDVQETGKWSPVTAMPADEAEMTEGDRHTGWNKQGIANANGAQCAVWQDSFGFEVCVWTGGGRWGYSSHGSTALHDGLSGGDAIVLWTHPASVGASWKLETKEFSVGKALDRRAFAIPENSTRGTPP
jgi:hypothetical protein